MEHKSHRLDITQLPRDANGSLGLLRSTLVKTFNYCRPYPTKVATLKLVLKYVYNRIVELEKYNESVAADQADKDAKAREAAAKADSAKPE